MKNMLTLFILFLLVSCGDDSDIIIDGMSPIYADITSSEAVSSEGPREIEDLGNLVNVGDYLFINERFQGIHVIDNSDPSNPTFMHFFKIIGNTEFTIDGDALFADNSRYLLVIDISDFENIKVVYVIRNQYGVSFSSTLFRPKDYIGRFECVEREEGIVVDWEFISLVNPRCSAF